MKKLTRTVTSGARTSELSTTSKSQSSPETPIRFDRSGVPEYIGGNSLRSVFALDGSKPQDDSTHADGCSLSAALESEDVDSSTSWVWKVPAVPLVPQHAPLERASLRIRDLSLDTIAARISDFMRVNSISCSYPSDHPGRVYCHTCTCIKFVVQLWEADDRATIVEVQRRRGCCVGMKFLRNCLYKSITSERGPSLNCCELPQRRPSKVLQEQISNKIHFGNQHQYARRRCSDGQLACLDLMESDKADENRLGIESFFGLTDSKNESAQEVARALVYNEGGISGRLRDSFLEALCTKLPSSHAGDLSVAAESAVSDDTSTLLEYSQCTGFGDSHLLALQALANCLESVASFEEDYMTNDGATLLQLSSSFWSRVLDVLVYNLKESTQHPQDAALSAKCIRILESLEPDTLSPFIENSVAPHLKKSYEFGKAHHLSLEKESEELLQHCSGDDHSYSSHEEGAPLCW